MAWPRQPSQLRKAYDPQGGNLFLETTFSIKIDYKTPNHATEYMTRISNLGPKRDKGSMHHNRNGVSPAFCGRKDEATHVGNERGQIVHLPEGPEILSFPIR